MAFTLSRHVGLLRKSLKKFNSQPIAIKCFHSFLLPIFEYCSPVWCSAAECHLNLLDRVLRQIKSIIPDLNIDLRHRRIVASLCMFYKIYNNAGHPVCSLFPSAYTLTRFTRHNNSLNSKSLLPLRCSTSQFQRSFVPNMVSLWNGLPDHVVDLALLQGFKCSVNALFMT